MFGVYGLLTLFWPWFFFFFYMNIVLALVDSMLWCQKTTEVRIVAWEKRFLLIVFVLYNFLFLLLGSHAVATMAVRERERENAG